MNRLMCLTFGLLFISSTVFSMSAKQSSTNSSAWSASFDVAAQAKICVNSILSKNLEASNLPFWDKNIPESVSFYQEAQSIFLILNKTLFSDRQVFILRAKKDVFARIEYSSSTSETRIIFIGRGFDEFWKAVPDELKQSYGAFIIAHEMSHYFYDKCRDQQPEIQLSYESGLSHGMVDAIALYLMELTGFDNRNTGQILGYIDHAMKVLDPNVNLNSPNMIADRSSRKIMMEKYFKTSLNPE